MFLVYPLQCDSKNINSYKVKLLQSFTYHPDIKRATRERGLLEETIKFVQKKKTMTLHRPKGTGYLSTNQTLIVHRIC